MERKRWRTRMVPLAVVGLLAGGLAAPAAAAPLSTLQQAVQQLQGEGVLGRSAGAAYGPDAPLRQAQVLAILRRFDARTGRVGHFTGAVFRLPAAAIVSRAQMLVELVNATGLHFGGSFAAAVRAAAGRHLLAGLPGVTEAPSAEALRGQLALMLLRLQQAGAPAAAGPVSSPPAAAAVLQGTVDQLQNSQGGNVLIVSTGSGTEAVPLAPTVQVVLSGQTVPLTQLTAGMTVALTLAPNGQAQLVTAAPAGAPMPVATTVQGTIASFANGQISLQPATPSAAAPTYPVTPTLVVTENGQGATTSALAPGDLATLHLLSGNVTWVAIRAAAASLSGALTAVAPSGFLLTASDGSATRVIVPAAVQVSLAGVALPRGALDVGETVTATGVMRSGALVARQVTITGDAVAGTP
jgi:hypothetical protein